MRCAEELADLLSAFADDALGPAQTEYVESHLACCRGCRNIVEAHHEVARLIRVAIQADEWPVPDMRLRVSLALAETRSLARFRRPLTGLTASALVAASLAWSALSSPFSVPGASVAISGVPPTATSVVVCGPCRTHGAPNNSPDVLAPVAAGYSRSTFGPRPM